MAWTMPKPVERKKEEDDHGKNEKKEKEKIIVDMQRRRGGQSERRSKKWNRGRSSTEAGERREKEGGDGRTDGRFTELLQLSFCLFFFFLVLLLCSFSHGRKKGLYAATLRR